MTPVVESPAQEEVQTDQYVRLAGATWADYERLLRIRGERAVPRITYLEGVLELMSPSRKHESIKSRLGRLVEAWCYERGVAFDPVGSWTLKSEATERGCEPDECFVFGERGEEALRPDLALEVVQTSGGLDKLELYRLLGVPEVWVWRGGRLEAFALRGDRYERLAGSEALPGIDLAQLVAHLDRPTSVAVPAYRRALRGEPAP